MPDTREIILLRVCDLATDFICYDRTEDKELPLGAIETAVKNGDVTIDEMMMRLEKELRVLLHPLAQRLRVR